MTIHQRILRLEMLLLSIYDALPVFIRGALPEVVHATMKIMKIEALAEDSGINVHEDKTIS